MDAPTLAGQWQSEIDRDPTRITYTAHRSVRDPLTGGTKPQDVVVDFVGLIAPSSQLPSETDCQPVPGRVETARSWVLMAPAGAPIGSAANEDVFTVPQGRFRIASIAPQQRYGTVYGLLAQLEKVG